jgi:hypothetical protein
MPCHGHTTTWGTPLGRGPGRNGRSWYDHLNAWWATHQAARHEAKLAALTARWDAHREAVPVCHADAAADLVLAAHPFAATTAFCDLAC